MEYAVAVDKQDKIRIQKSISIQFAHLLVQISIYWHRAIADPDAIEDRTAAAILIRHHDQIREPTAELSDRFKAVVKPRQVFAACLDEDAYRSVMFQYFTSVRPVALCIHCVNAFWPMP